jgi:hypothetical protein
MAASKNEIFRNLGMEFPTLKNYFGSGGVSYRYRNFLNLLLRMQGYQIEFISDVCKSIIPVLEERKVKLETKPDNSVHYCIVIVKSRVFFFPVDKMMPNSFVLSQAIRKYVSSEDNGGEDDSNAIGLYNMSQNYCLDLSDDVGDSMKREDILATTGFTVPSVGLRTKTATPQDELESHKKAMQSRQLDAQRIDQKISPFMLPVSLSHMTIDGDDADNNQGRQESGSQDQDEPLQTPNPGKTKLPPEQLLTYCANGSGSPECNDDTYTFHKYELHAPVYTNSSRTVQLKRIYMRTRFGWVFQMRKPDGSEVNLYGVPGDSAYAPSSSIEYRCMSGNPPGPTVKCFGSDGKEVAHSLAQRNDAPDLGKVRRKKRKKKKKKKSKRGEGEKTLDSPIGDSLKIKTGEKLKLSGLKNIFSAKKEEELNAEMMLVELEHKICHYFKRLDITNTANVDVVAKKYLWNELELFQMMKEKFGVDIHDIEIPDLPRKDAESKAKENIERKRRERRSNNRLNKKAMLL